MQFLIGLLLMAGMIALACLLLPVVLVFFGVALLIGVCVWLWMAYQAKKNGVYTEQFQEQMYRGAGQAQDEDEGFDVRSQQQVQIETIKTTDNKRWKMDDVEDVREDK